MTGYYDWLVVVVNLGKSRKSWGRLSWILSREGVDPKVSGKFYKAVAQAVLMFGAETWVLTPRMERSLDRFHNRVARRITGRQPRRQGGWELGVTAFGEGNGGSGIRGYQRFCHEESQHGRTVYCDAANYGPL